MKKNLYVRIAIVFVALLLITVGIIKGDFMDVFNKAAHICYECIGIG